MKDKTDVMGLVRLICNFYNNYREYLHMTHEEARHKVELMYDDLFLWVYEDELKASKKETTVCQECGGTGNHTFDDHDRTFTEICDTCNGKGVVTTNE